MKVAPKPPEDSSKTETCNNSEKTQFFSKPKAQQISKPDARKSKKGITRQSNHAKDIQPPSVGPTKEADTNSATQKQQTSMRIQKTIKKAT